MKKIITSLLIAVFLVVPFSVANAQTLTRENVETIAPQLIQVLSSLSVLLDQEQNRLQLERSILAGGGQLLSNISTRLSQNPTQTEIDTMANQVTSLSNELIRISERRIAFNQSIDTITQILGAIVEELSEINA